MSTNRNHNPKRLLITILLLLYIVAAAVLIATDIRLQHRLELLQTIISSQQAQLEITRDQLESARTYIEAHEWICPECGAINSTRSTRN